MDPFTLSALIGGGAQAIGQGINAWQTGRMNKASRAFSRQMYEKQRADSIEFWNMQNAYNSPSAQVQRMRDAGLNPALMYGGSGGSTPAGSIPTPDVQRPQFDTPRWGDASSGALATLSAMYDLDIKAAQADNLRSQNTVIVQDALLKAAEIANTNVRTARGQFDLQFESDLRETSADARRELLRKLKTDIDVTTHRDAREAAMNASNISEAIERMANLREQRLNYQLQRTKDATEISRIRADIARIKQTTENAKKEGKLRDLEIELRQQGINPNDPLWSRVVGRFLSGFFGPDGTPKDLGNSIWNYFFSE